MLLFKVDFEKAYNSVDLSYLDMVMQKNEFSDSLEEVDVCLCWDGNGFGVG